MRKRLYSSLKIIWLIHIILCYEERPAQWCLWCLSVYDKISSNSWNYSEKVFYVKLLYLRYTHMWHKRITIMITMYKSIRYHSSDYFRELQENQFITLAWLSIFILFYKGGQKIFRFQTILSLCSQRHPSPFFYSHNNLNS